jgi:hypothetical protein
MCSARARVGWRRSSRICLLVMAVAFVGV